MDIMKRNFMKMSCFALSSLLMFATLACSSKQLDSSGMKVGRDANWDRYRPASLQELIDEHSKHINASPKFKININAIAANDPHRIQVIYMDEFRNISDDKKFLLTSWGKSTRMDERFIKIFEQEALFIDGSNSYWFPVQSQLIPHFRKEIARGDAVYLYVMLIGTVWEGDEMPYLFIVNEFKPVLN